jgi:hypothetical protein
VVIHAFVGEQETKSNLQQNDSQEGVKINKENECNVGDLCIKSLRTIEEHFTPTPT